MKQNLKELNPWDQVAHRYQDDVISPIHNSVYSPLEDYLKNIKNPHQKTAGDLGCGTGPLIPILSNKFKNVIALDFSKEMIKLSFERMQNHPAEQLKKVIFEQSCLTKLSFIKEKLDVALTINSLIMTEPSAIKKSFQGIFESLKNNGVYIGVFPALEAVSEEYHHTYQKEYKKFKSHELAKSSTRKKLRASKINFELGHYNTGDMLQKYFTRYELENYLSESNFKNISFDRVIYEKRFSYNYHDQNLKNHPHMWDHFVICEK